MSTNYNTQSKGRKIVAVILTLVMALTIYSGAGLFGTDAVYADVDPAVWQSSTSGKNIISMSDSDQDIKVTFNIEAENETGALAAVDAGSFYLYRDKGIMYNEVDQKGQKVYPYEFIARGDGRGRLPEAAGGAPWKLSQWKQLNTNGQLRDTDLFSDFKTSAADNSDGTFEITYEFKAKTLFNTTNVDDRNVRTALLDAVGDYKFEFCTSGNYDSSSIAASSTVRYNPYKSYRAMPEIYGEITELKDSINGAGYYAKVETLGKTTGGRDMPYLIFAKNENAVTKYKTLMERAETDPSGVIADIKADNLGDYQVPILYSNIHADEVNGVDSILNFTQDIVKAKSENSGKIDYKLIDSDDPFTDDGAAQYQTERDARGAVMPSVFKQLKKDRQPTGLGYITTNTASENSRKVDLDKYYNMKNETLDVDALLDEVFFIIVPEQNVDGRVLNAREGYGGIDLNRDNLFQTQAETQNMTKMIAAWNPIVFWEQHGFVRGFQVEPCTPPHEANFEYDLLSQNLTRVGEAYGNGAISNNDTYNSFKMPMRDYFYENSSGDAEWDVWDDVSTAYTPEYAMLHGTVSYTVEVPYADEAGNTALEYGLINNAKFVADNRDDLFLNQVKGYERGVKNIDASTNNAWYEDIQGNVGAEANVFRPKYTENSNFFPEYYVIPVDQKGQRNVKAAEEMQKWLLDSDVKLSKLTEDMTFTDAEDVEQTAKAGSIVVDMHQAKRNVANVALGNGLTLKNWKTTLYSEPVTAFSEMRGFTQHTVTTEDAFTGKLSDVGSAIEASSPDIDKDYAVILNSGVESTKAINALLGDNAKVGLITDGKYKGHFSVKKAEYDAIKGDFDITAESVAEAPKASIIKKPKVYLSGAPTSEFNGGSTPYGAREKVRVASGYYEYNYNYKALATEMGFDVTTTDAEGADVIVGANALSGGALTEVQDGTPYVGWGNGAVTTAKSVFSNKGIGSLESTNPTSNGDALYTAKQSDDSIVMAHKNYFNDNIVYNFGCGYITSVPEGSEILAKVDGKDILAGSMPKDRYSGFANSIQGFEYQKKGVNMTVFAHPLARKNHQKDDYTIISTSIFNAAASEIEDSELKLLSVDTAPTASGLFVGDKLSKSDLTGGIAVDKSSKKLVKGTFTWVDPSIVPPLGVSTAKAAFIPEDDSYKAIKVDVEVAVSEKEATDIADGKISSIADQTYDGSVKEPKVQFILNENGKNVVLKEGTDYVLDYQDNLNAGTAKVIVTGANEYKGTCEGEFTINPASLSNVSIAAIANQTYKGKAVTPNPSVELNNVPLLKNTDYTVTYAKNNKVGKASLTISGKGNYTGQKSAAFTIYPQSTSISKITVGKAKMKASWKKVSGANYQIAYRPTSSKSWKYKTVSSKYSSVTLTKLSKGKKYYVKVRSYSKSDGKTFYSKWSTAKISGKIKK